MVQVHSSHPSLAGNKPLGERPRDDDEIENFIQTPSTFDKGVYDENVENEDENDYVLESLEEVLQIQKERHGENHPSVTRTLHSLALEYKIRSRYEQAISCLREAVELVTVRLEGPTFNNEEDSCNIEECKDDSSVSPKSIGSSSTNSTSQATAMVPEQKILLLEEKSCLLSCIGNIHKIRGMVKDSIDTYMEAVNLLIEAGYPGDSRKVNMIIRILKRLENKQKM
mmetsp:Transcript_21098/g.29562  ORF Transcript_21098/g.29562 Transcript_21098/m.29562 type:complete len:226 (+) Transcript_21098:82-759(+)